MQYKRKPEIVEAIQITEDMILDNDLPAETYVGSSSFNMDRREVFSFRGHINTSDDRLDFSIGDWILTSVKGDMSVCTPELFVEFYEPV